MAIYTVRRQLDTEPAADPRDIVSRTSVHSHSGGGQWQCSVWTPGNRELVCMFEGDAPPTVEGAEIQQVIEVHPDEFMPIVNELDPTLKADPLAQSRGSLVVIRRDVRGWTEDDLRSAALRAMMCSFEYPELTWVRTYWAPDNGRTLCLFRTKDHAQAREHSERSRIPCDEVLDAEELTAADLQSNRGESAIGGSSPDPLAVT